jgi:DNA invertase Pin-like site-specific DNA recombinase
VAEFTEVESGKRHQNRPQLAAALDYCRRRNGILLIATLDRLARNVQSFEETLARCSIVSPTTFTSSR